MPSNQWFALRVQSSREHAVATSLHQKGYEVFLPLYRQRRMWSDRLKEVDCPLFAGYLFCQIDLNSRSNPVVTTPGVRHIVGLAGKPAPIEEHEIAAVRKIVESQCKSEPWSTPQPGESVRILHGPLTGIEGKLIEIKSQHQLVVSVSLLQRSVAVQVERAWCASV
jgi:transcription antitermination factor NusG